MEYGDRAVGDVVKTQYGSVVMLVGVNETLRNLTLADIGISLTPTPGLRVVFEYGRRICSMDELVKHGAEKFDFTTKAEIPDNELSELDKVKRDNQRLEVKFAALEAQLKLQQQ